MGGGWWRNWGEEVGRRSREEWEAGRSGKERGVERRGERVGKSGRVPREEGSGVSRMGNRCRREEDLLHLNVSIRTLLEFGENNYMPGGY